MHYKSDGRRKMRSCNSIWRRPRNRRRSRGVRRQGQRKNERRWMWRRCEKQRQEKKQKTVGSVDEDGSEVPEGFTKGKLCYLCQKMEVICYWLDKQVFLLMSSI